MDKAVQHALFSAAVEVGEDWLVSQGWNPNALHFLNLLVLILRVC